MTETETMDALVYTGARALEHRRVERPVPSSGEVLVRVASCGICGSDMHAYLGHDERRPPPLVLGHEAAGIVEGTGARVAVNPLAACGRCAACRRGRPNLCPERQILSLPPRPGAFAGYVAVPERNLVAVPEGVTLDHAALAEPLACGWHAVRLARAALDLPLMEARCAVLGGGAIGVGAALALRAFGAGDITLLEPNALRRERLAAIDAFGLADPRQGPEAADLVVDAVGLAATRAAACALVRPGGVIAHIGLGEATGGLDARRMTLQEVTFVGTYTYTDRDFRDAARAIFEGRMGTLDWIETRPLAAGPRAFEDIRAGRAASPKIVLIPARP